MTLVAGTLYYLGRTKPSAPSLHTDPLTLALSLRERGNSIK